MVLFAAATLPIRLINGSWNVCVSAQLWSGVTLLSYALAPALSPHLAKKHTHEHTQTHCGGKTKEGSLAFIYQIINYILVAARALWRPK